MIPRWVYGLAIGAWFLVGCAPPTVVDGLLVGKNDLVVPEMIVGEPESGRWVRGVLPGYEATDVYHGLYLPRDWRADRTYPVIVEYAGNGPFENKYGDSSTGRVEGCVMGYGMSGGEGYIWLSLPFVDSERGENAIKWWGDVEATVAYCKAAVNTVCERYGGDRGRVVLAGFSRGAIACHYIGLHDDTIASLWRGFVCHSHYDGVKTWGYAGSDRAAALGRLKRLRGRPEFISQENDGVGRTQAYLESVGVDGDFTFVAMPFFNHTAEWTLKDLPERRLLRRWLERVTAER